MDQVGDIRHPRPELQELTCKQTPGKRAWHNALAFEERLYVFGGKNGETDFKADTWYRDAVFPISRMIGRPDSNTDDAWFK